MLYQVPQFIKGFLLGLPIWGILGWFANRLLVPIFDELGVRLKSWIMARFNKDEYSIYVAYSNLHKLIAELHTTKGHNFFNTQKPYLDNHEINLEVKSKISGQLRNIASMWIHQARISSYEESDIFFAGMEFLLSYLTQSNVEDIFNKHKDNPQANLWPFLEIVERERSDLLTADILQYLRDKQKWWNDILVKREEKEK